MSALTVPIIIAVVIIGIGLLQVQQRALARKKRKQALQNLSQLKHLIGLLQKHRGLTATYLQSGKLNDQALCQVRTQIQPICQRLHMEDGITEQPHWQAFRDHWQRLQSGVNKLTVAQSFTQHTNLISNLLLLLEDCAEAGGLTRWELPDMPHIALLWREFPATVEYIGQARAVGMAVTTAGECDQVNRVRLGYLHKRIEDLAENIFMQFEQRADTSKAVREQIQDARKHCRALCNAITDTLLAEGPVTLAPEDYFTLASCAMDSANRVMNLEFEHIESSLQTSVAA